MVSVEHPLEPLLRVRVAMVWEDIERVRELLESCVAHRCGLSIAERVALVAHELLENALRYGSVQGEVELNVEVGRQDGGFLVRVSNDAVPNRLELLRAAMARSSAGDAEETYLDAITRSKGRAGQSGIGLARIRRDAHVELALDIDGTWVTISAHGRTVRRRPSMTVRVI